MGIIDVLDNIRLIDKKRDRVLPVLRRQATEKSCSLGCMPDAEQMPDGEDMVSDRIQDK